MGLMRKAVMVVSGRVPSAMAGVTLGVWQVWVQLLVCDTGPVQCLLLWFTPSRGEAATLLLAEDMVGMHWLQGCPPEGQLLNCSKIASFPFFVRKVTISFSQLGLMEPFDESGWERGKEKLSRHSFGLWLISALTSDTAAQRWPPEKDAEHVCTW